MIDLARLFSSRHNAFIGMDIGRHAVRMVELSRGKAGAFMLQGYGSEELAVGAVGEDGIDDLDHVMAAARRLWERSDFKARKVAIGIPASAVAVHTFSARQAHTESEIEQLAREHIRTLLNYGIAEACIDFCLVEPVSRLVAQTEVLVAAARRESVEDRLAVAESLDLHAVVADAESYAADAALLRAGASGAADPFAGMALAAGIQAERLKKEAPAYLVACGLALRGFD